MSTAAEILARINATMPALEVIRRNFELQQMLIFGTSIVKIMGREVCARRARKLRKRGHQVVFHSWTVNGKCRYRWVKRIGISPDKLYREV